jgi:hypothetical protein
MGKDSRKIVHIADIDRELSEYDEDTIFVLEDPPLKNPLLKNESTIDEKSE